MTGPAAIPLDDLKDSERHRDGLASADLLVNWLVVAGPKQDDTL